MRKTKFADGEYYHIYNRGVDKREVFCEEKDYLRFLANLRLFNNNSKREERNFILKKRLEQESEQNTELSSEASELSSVFCSDSASLFLNKEIIFFLESMPKLVEIICYCLNPNHYHFILKQLTESGVSKFLHKLDLGYTNYFNVKNSRSGSLFQGTFQAVHIDTNEYLLWLSGYINGNAEIHKVAKAENYKWCSYPDYLGKRRGTLCNNKEMILSQFQNLEKYQEFVNMAIEKSRERKDLGKYLIE